MLQKKTEPVEHPAVMVSSNIFQIQLDFRDDVLDSVHNRAAAVRLPLVEELQPGFEVGDLGLGCSAREGVHPGGEGDEGWFVAPAVECGDR